MNDARKRVPTAKRVGMSADQRRGWARGGSAAYRIPARAPTRSPQGHRARQNAAKNHAGSVVNPADLHAEGNARGARRAKSRPRRESGRASSTRSPAVDAEGVTAGRGMASPRRRPRPAASAAGPWPKRGRPSPSSAHALRGSSTAPRLERLLGRPRPRWAWGRAHGGTRRTGGRQGRAWGEGGGMGESAANGGRRATRERIMGFLLLRTPGIVGVKGSSKRDT